MGNKEKQDVKTDQEKGKVKKVAENLNGDDAAGGAAVPGRSEDEHPSPTRLPGIPGHGMTSNMFDDED